MGLIWEVGGYADWEYAPNVFKKTEDGKDVIYRYCEGMNKVWNAVEISTYEYATTDRVVVIICHMGYFMEIDIYRKSRYWEVLRRRVLSCNDLPYVIPVVKRVLAWEGFKNVDDVVNHIAERWIGVIRFFTQL
jgi:hypothetical protein